MTEKLPDGRIVEGGPGDMKAKISLSPREVKELRMQMYKDFLQAKQDGKINLAYTFDSWLRDSMNTLRTLRKADLDTEYRLGKLSRAEHEALDEMRQKMISVILAMDVSDLDKYGIQHIDPSMAQVASAHSAPLDNRLLIPTQRKNVVKFKKEIKQ